MEGDTLRPSRMHCDTQGGGEQHGFGASPPGCGSGWGGGTQAVSTPMLSPSRTNFAQLHLRSGEEKANGDLLVLAPFR